MRASISLEGCKHGFALRSFVLNAAGLDENSRFLGHWFGLTKTGGAQLEDQLPRPSPWNYFCDEEAIVDASSSAGVTKGEAGLRKFASDAGLAADSKFLSH